VMRLPVANPEGASCLLLTAHCEGLGSCWWNKTVSSNFQFPISIFPTERQHLIDRDAYH
jgi:hypothetical protein